MYIKTPTLSLAILCIILQGCSSFGRGIAEAVLEKQEQEDTRVCEVWGGAFRGLDPDLDNSQGLLKVLMVHGVGDHQPGYATQFLEKLSKQLNLTVSARQPKNLSLVFPSKTTKPLGNLRIHRLLNKDRTKEMQFYELSWSEITAEDKKVLAYDNSGEYSFRRAHVNDLLKKFSNDTGPDPIIYLGQSRQEILLAFDQAFCWMSAADWDDLPDQHNEFCDFSDAKINQHIVKDKFSVISHSLGSRITIDGLQRFLTILKNDKSTPGLDAMKPGVLLDALKEKEITLYMMSNQLPMLQLGRKMPEITGKHDDYCTAEGTNYNQRMFQQLSLIAISDPNDLLSYAIPPHFVDEYLDSRLCINATNVNINVASVFDVFGMGKMANPLDAHIGYESDDRVVGLIAHGIGNPQTAEIVNDNCTWTETVD